MLVCVLGDIPPLSCVCRGPVGTALNPLGLGLHSRREDTLRGIIVRYVFLYSALLEGLSLSLQNLSHTINSILNRTSLSPKNVCMELYTSEGVKTTAIRIFKVL